MVNISADKVICTTPFQYVDPSAQSNCGDVNLLNVANEVAQT